mmetsp:Transcript_22339/g.72018  ORF Transcript_22339/g.72018 Transcript_22339/m.72018 type:complete len:686 (-) Transcript_22339:343-2400(-)|eukprot:CAMPEP_0118900240 /NCGR_PEP_ID=MMETSP1166-20130328/6441_1 /TAXON_ID=1104430 /ORGANISM="Chrysoreinhardia sp, Strain CCMP3193" /LENGTH=685 /DNA_ID=CAMNT_0006839379 /DNA_START=60 /DNA_END=2117 /DNA_ORIENTATION=-
MCADFVVWQGLHNRDLSSSISLLRKSGFGVSVREAKGREYLVVRASRRVLEVEAEHVGLLKRRAADGLTEEFSAGEGEKFARYRCSDFFEDWEIAWLSGSLLGQLSSLSDATIIPLHDRKTLESIEWLRTIASPEAQLTAYFGPRIGVYFAWMNAFTTWLPVPAVVGLVLFIRKRLAGITIDDDPYAPFFSLFVIAWSALFEAWWPRTEAAYAHKWGVFALQEDRFLATKFQRTRLLAAKHQDLDLRRKRRRRILAYLLSVVVTAFTLVVAGAWHFVSLNVQGYVQRTSTIDSYAYYEPAATFGKRLLAADPTGLAPTLLHVLVVRQLNSIYRSIATHLTALEQHETKQNAENALVLKRFLFEAFDAYAALFYLAFVNFDIVKLRTELVTIYSVDAVRRFTVESFIPGLSTLLFRPWAAGGTAAAAVPPTTAPVPPTTDAPPRTTPPRTKGGDDDDEKAGYTSSSSSESSTSTNGGEDQLRLVEYENFDDYLEIVIEFGYVTLFASAFPLGPLLSLVCNVIEMKNDVLKLLFVSRRPLPGLSITASTTADVGASIGVWHSVLRALVWLGVLTNTALFAFTSEQMAAWLPSLFVRQHTRADAVAKQGKGPTIILLAFALEHLVALLVLLIQSLVPALPDFVVHDHARRSAEKMSVAKQLRREKLVTLANANKGNALNDVFFTRRYC